MKIYNCHNVKNVSTQKLIFNHSIKCLIVGEKPHPCELCGKRFRVRSDMKRHLRTHGRKRVSRGVSVQDDVVLPKVESAENVENNVMIDNEDLSEVKYKVSDSNSAKQEHQLQYNHETLDGVRDGNTLYVMPILIT